MCIATTMFHLVVDTIRYINVQVNDNDDDDYDNGDDDDDDACIIALHVSPGCWRRQIYDNE